MRGGEERVRHNDGFCDIRVDGGIGFSKSWILLNSRFVAGAGVRRERLSTDGVHYFLKIIEKSSLNHFQLFLHSCQKRAPIFAHIDVYVYLQEKLEY